MFYLRTLSFRIFEDHPDWRDYFKDVHGENVMSPEFRAAAARLGADYDILMDVLENEDEIDMQLQHMASKYRPPVMPEGFIAVSTLVLPYIFKKRLSKIKDIY